MIETATGEGVIVGDPVTGDSGAAATGLGGGGSGGGGGGGSGDGGVVVVESGGVGGSGGGGSYGGGGGGPGPNIKNYNIDIEEIEDLARDPKKEKIKKLAKNCSQGNKELCGWIMHKFGKMKEAKPKGYNIILGYELNATKAKKSNKPIFGIIVRQSESKKLKEIPVPKSCGDCVVPTVWRNNGDEKCFKIPPKENEKIMHFCVKPCKEYLFQIYILIFSRKFQNQQIILNGYENAQNYELLNRIGQIVKPKLFWVEPIDKRNKIFKVNELSLNLSKININFPVFSDFLDLNKGSQEKVRNLLMTPEIIEFYVENPGLVTREVKQLLIALSDCYDVAKRYTGIFCEIAIDEDKIEAYGGGDVDEACKKLLKEKKMGRFNEDLNVDNGCGGGGGGGGGQKREPVKNYADEIERLKKIEKNKELSISELIEFIMYLDQTNDETKKNNTEISKLKDDLELLLSKNYKSLQNIKKSSSSSSGSSGSTEQPPLMFLNNCIDPYTCWIDSLLYFLYGFSNVNYYSYFTKNNFTENFMMAFEYIKFGKDLKDQCILQINKWNVNFLQRLLPQQNEYRIEGFNDPAQVLENILETIQGTSTTEAERQEKPDPISQLIKPKDESIIDYEITQDNFYNTFYEDTKIKDLLNNFLFQTCAGRRGKSSSRYRSLLLANIKIPIYNGETAANINYNLQSFIVHKGGIHYVCYFNNSGQWWYYNDLANNFTKENSLEDIKKKIDSTTDYIILYNYARVLQT